MKKQLILLLTLFSLSFAFGQGLEDFTNSNATSSYANNSFTGNNGITWTYVKSRDEDGDANNSGINGKALMLQKQSKGSKITSSTISNGIGDLSVKLYKGFTGGGNRQVELFINGVSKGTSTPFDDYSEHVFSVTGINITGNIVIEIKDITSKQVIIDDISWTAYTNSTTPTITVTPTSLTGFTYEEGNGPSAEQTYTVEGSNLTGNIVISPPTNWEISTTSGGPYQTTGITLTQSGGTVSATNIYIRMVEGLLAANLPFSSIVAHESAGATQADLNVDGTVTAPVLPCSQLLISEYGEPSSGNGKYIEIYNPTSQAINLSNYELWKITNGGNWPETTYSLTGVLAPYNTFTLANNASDVPNANEYTTTSIMLFSGDDAMGLAYNGGSGNSFSLIDVIGTEGADPGSGWNVAGVTNGTKDHTLIRKASVQNPNTDWASSAGTTTANSEWEVVTYGLDNFGSHSSDCFCSGTTTTWTSTGWSNSAPTIHDMAIIESDYNTSQSGSFEACTLVINSGILNIELGNYIKVRHSIENKGSIVIDHQGSLVQVENSATVTGTGTYSTTVKTTSMADARYTYFSSPSNTDTMNVFNSWAATGRMFGWDGTSQVWSAVTTATPMTPGLGYIVRPTTVANFSNPFTTNFTGAFNNGIVTTTLYNTNVYSGNDDDSSLVGNPYPSAINTQALLDANPNANAFYFWSHDTGLNWSGESYKTWTLLGGTSGAPVNIATGQGFFVTSTAAGTFTFSNDQRVTGNNDTFLRPANNLDKVWLNVISDTNAGSQILVGFIPTKTDGFDAQYDAAQINSGTDNISFSSKGTDANTTNLVIQARNVLSDDDTIIPLNVFINDANIQTATISIDHLENLTDRNIFLKDNLLNTLTDLKQGNYPFTVSQTGVINNRFEVLFSRNALAVNENSVTTQLTVAQKGDYFTLSTSDNHTIDSANLYNMLGQNLGFFKANSNNLQIPATNIASGTVLIIKTTLDNGNVISKKVVKL